MQFYKHGDLLLELTKREIKSKYKQSILGYAWVLLVPLINLLVMSVVFSYFVRIQTGGIPYPIYLFAGLVPWLYTTNAITLATGSIVQNIQLITKIYLPRQVFPMASILSKTIDFLLMFIIMLVFMYFNNVTFSWMILYVPLIFLVQFVLILGISYVLSAINVYFRDVENVIGVFLSMWMYLSPVLYPPEIVPVGIRPIFNLNPMAPIINAYRNVLIYHVSPPWQSFMGAVATSVVIFIIGRLVFKKLSRNFADVI